MQSLESVRRYRTSSKGKAMVRRANEKIRAAQRAYLAKYKSESGRADCGERDPVVLTFAHKEPRSRNGGRAVSSMTGSGWPSLLKEIERCDVLCWNCHTRRDDSFRRKHPLAAPGGPAS